MFLTCLTLIRSYFCVSSFVSVEMFLFMTYSRTESTFLLHRPLSLFPRLSVGSLDFTRLLDQLRDDPFWGCVLEWVMGFRLIGVMCGLRRWPRELGCWFPRSPKWSIQTHTKVKPMRDLDNADILTLESGILSVGAPTPFPPHRTQATLQNRKHPKIHNRGNYSREFAIADGTDIRTIPGEPSCGELVSIGKRLSRRYFNFKVSCS
jgi:hypothetical protein